MTILVGVVYLPHGNIDIFGFMISGIFEKYTNIIVMGDFNNDLFNTVKAGRIRALSYC